MLASGSLPVQAADLPTGVDHQRSDPESTGPDTSVLSTMQPSTRRRRTPAAVTSSATGQLVAPTGRLHELVNGVIMRSSVRSSLLAGSCGEG